MTNKIKKLCELNREKSLIETEIAELKSEIETELGGKDYKDDSVTITFKQGASRTSIDLKEFEKKEPELYKELYDEYAKTTEGKPTVQYRFK